MPANRQNIHNEAVRSIREDFNFSMCLRIFKHILSGREKMSLKIEKKNEGTKDTVFLTGRLDTTTASELDTFAEKELINTQELVLDFTGLEYISSAGLRVILKMQKFMNVKGTMKLIHVSDIIQDVFDITGFADILSIE